MDCLFCEIINKNKPAYILFENEFITAFLDIYPVTKGHLLIVPNKHYETLDHLENDKNTSAALMSGCIKAAKRLKKNALCTDYTILQDNGKLANQDIMHVHFHVIPRSRNDGVLMELNTAQSLADESNLIKLHTLLRDENPE